MDTSCLEIFKYKKIIVVGCPGSGKSYFSKELSNILNIPVYHLDCIYWQPNWVSLPSKEFSKKINEIMENKEWILDGNYQKTLEERVKKSEIVFFLDLSVEECLQGERERRGVKRDDLPSYLEETFDPEFLNFIKNFPNEGRKYILELMLNYPNVSFISFKSRKHVTEYLQQLKSYN